ncbi:bifunctional 4-hydroxy-2-oxoglutarate aldolase/2-dehydro-3-deoxy-phosphogluconate aldolase [Enterovirga sp.]|jgi:2-dehydro-3-deoxyphosphogluconate aldolase/(4S)-4-hydroxy-2-oxoglutarate aldolase|uniref:bifunctional 4-hydroxy-2-oxoglutarate aldolase/2-dehydro-3-deoxy-phosphogluconate aldolase n=1 Tax=Enterovirga sp. TaxID=2026350 RepID=UPI002610A59D|nr:bifunctional 4-hydroxy-2-oxoglutarate aldolase/2-dehydro-3-deoxy-phosphogluconate aldolase [Enterovirga sp.]MDB5590587.1 keto-deoxy-phosphogluconate aldolase [Enterovirga sp.]
MKTDLLAGFAAMAPVIPVVTIEDVAQAAPLARTLLEAGLPVIEVTLRTGRALAAIEAIAREVPEAVVGAGTLLRPDQIEPARAAGARFLVTPGTTRGMADALAESDLPALPGCATVSEAIALAELGFRQLKFFPAIASGGQGWLKQVAGPLPHLRFCPTGGLDLGSAATLLALPNVMCVGGAWMVPPAALAAADWTTIAALARAAAALPRPRPYG